MPVFDHRQGPSERSGRAASRQSTAAATRPATPLLAAQNAAGNTAVVQMLRQAGHSFAQHTHGAGRGQEAGAGAKASADALPVQRVAKQSVQQPTPEYQSAEVPDLPRALTEALNNARTAAERRIVLHQMLQYLLERFTDLSAFGMLSGDQEGLLENLRERVQVTYSHTRPGEMAVTRERLDLATGEQIDSPPIVITVYRDAFDGGVAQLYSVMRHELIHAAQRSMVPDEGRASADDDVMFEDLYEPGTGVPTRNTLQLPLQEIETHVWELTHADETGVQGGYRADTVTYLLEYAETLTTGVSRATGAQFSYWVNYLIKAVRLLLEAADVVTDAQSARRIRRAAERLQNAIDSRLGSGGGSKSGSKRSGGSGGGSGSGSSSKRRRSRRTAA